MLSICQGVLERTLLPALSPSALAFDPNAVKVRTVAADKQAPGRQLHVARSRLSQIAVFFLLSFFFPPTFPFPSRLVVASSAALRKIALV